MVEQRVARLESPSDGLDDLTVARRIIEGLHLQAFPWGRAIHPDMPALSLSTHWRAAWAERSSVRVRAGRVFPVHLAGRSGLAGDDYNVRPLSISAVLHVQLTQRVIVPCAPW